MPDFTCSLSRGNCAADRALADTLDALRASLAADLGVSLHVRLAPGDCRADADDAVPVLRMPITFSDGTHYGDLCSCAWRGELLDVTTLKILQLMTQVISLHLEPLVLQRQRLLQTAKSIDELVKCQLYDVVFQPIVDLAKQRPAGFEALTRFRAEPLQSPDKWFLAAGDVGRREELEIAVIARALLSLDRLPANAYLSLNLSPATLFHRDLAPLLSRYPLERLVLEITEHEAVDDYDKVRWALKQLRRAGLRLAVDDTGAGFASFSHVMNLSPEVIKLDRSLVSDIDHRDELQALTGAMATFAGKTGASLVAEGIETTGEHDVLVQLGVSHGQGYLLGRPMSLLAQGYGSQLRPVVPGDVAGRKPDAVMVNTR